MGLILVGGFSYIGYLKFQTPSSNNQTKLIEIPKGSGLLDIAILLKSEQIISDPYVFIAISKFLPPKDTIKAGEYQFQSGSMMIDVIAKLKKGDIFKRQFTIPEGLTSFEIIQRLKSIPDIYSTDIKIPAEGSLLPNTYQFEKNEKIESVLSRMASALTKVIDDNWAGRDANLPIKNTEEALILASIVEKETGVPSERKRIAGVFINRLRLGMPLQTDPTVIYALTMGQHQNDGQGPLGRRILTKDLQIDSPYNTYKYSGLPPTPIANAGKDAILAVLHPEAHDFIFFVADGTGGHLFAKTYAEHNKNVTNWRKVRKN